MFRDVTTRDLDSPKGRAVTSAVGEAAVAAVPALKALKTAKWALKAAKRAGNKVKIARLKKRVDALDAQWKSKTKKNLEYDTAGRKTAKFEKNLPKNPNAKPKKYADVRGAAPKGKGDPGFRNPSIQRDRREAVADRAKKAAMAKKYPGAPKGGWETTIEGAKRPNGSVDWNKIRPDIREKIFKNAKAKRERLGGWKPYSKR